MSRPIRQILTAMLLSMATLAHSEEAITYDFDGDFDDASFAIENAIIDAGLVVDYVSHLGEMLRRTGEDLGSDVELFDNAQVFLFCSAVVSREVMEADPANIVHCPFSIYIADLEGRVTIGHRNYPDGPMDKVEALLKGIVEDALAD